MSNALAIAAVTASLKDLISDSLNGLDLSSIGSVGVSALPPDRIATGENEPNQLNLFLYQVSANIGLRNHGLASRDGAGQRSGNPPLALDLHYLLSAYGGQDLSGDALLGLGMQALHETPGLDRARLRAVLGPPTPPFGDFSALSLADQIESLKITPQFLSTEELSKLWTAAQARYRPSMGYQVSVVLIQSEAAARSAPPVLRRGAADRGPVAVADTGPQLRALDNLASELLRAARLGDALRLSGAGLDAQTCEAAFANARTGVLQILPTFATGDAGRVRVQLPDDQAALAAWTPGLYTVRVRCARPGLPVMSTAPLPLMLAPRLSVTPLAAPIDAEVELTLRCRPRLHALQAASVRVLVGGHELPPESVDTPADPTQPTTVVATLPAAQAKAGDYPVVLRVDGIDSIPAIPTDQGFAFDPQQTLVLS